MNDIKENNQENHILRLKRLRYRSWHRGCKETDVILGHFADNHLESLKPDELNIYETLLEEQDADIWAWLVGKDTPENKAYVPILAILNEFSTAQYKMANE